MSPRQPAPSSGPQAEALLRALLAWGAAFAEFERRFRSHTGMHVTDSQALIHVTNGEDAGSPLTPSALSRRLGLSSGATSSLLNRLEVAGHVERRRESVDRRVVTLHSTPAVHREVDAFFAAVGADLRADLAARPAEVVAEVADVLGDLTAVLERHLDPATTERAARPSQR